MEGRIASHVPFKITFKHQSYMWEARWPEEFENRASIPLLSLPSTLKTTVKGAFRKYFLKTEEFENEALRFTVDGKHFENGAFRKR